MKNMHSLSVTSALLALCKHHADSIHELPIDPLSNISAVFSRDNFKVVHFELHISDNSLDWTGVPPDSFPSIRTAAGLSPPPLPFPPLPSQFCYQILRFLVLFPRQLTYLPPSTVSSPDFRNLSRMRNLTESARLVVLRPDSTNGLGNLPLCGTCLICFWKDEARFTPTSGYR
ncbi:hypothetical protein IW262DRAFT_410495 [Armillaria fumosa]|nr:hypothetical protein IW262DRAFT_672574 [Armillaria fumosa]KAK0230536.1 hypothetical protein IW262DRAFT_410495 [Armillaria fumosa]